MSMSTDSCNGDDHASTRSADLPKSPPCSCIGARIDCCGQAAYLTAHFFACRIRHHIAGVGRVPSSLFDMTMCAAHTTLIVGIHHPPTTLARFLVRYAHETMMQ
jgi:hypothetical protein